MATIQKFLFEADFDGDGLARPPVLEPVPEPEPEPPPPPPPPSFSEEELAQAVEKARAEARAVALEEGRAQGRAQAETAAQQALTQVLNAVNASLAPLMAQQKAEMDLRRQNTNRLTLAIIRKLWPGMVQRHGLAEMEGVIALFLEELAEEPKLVFRVHERWLTEMQNRIGDIALRHGFAGQVTVLTDPKLGEMDVKADWAAGGAERDTGALWASVERIAGGGLADFPGGPPTQ